MNSKNSIKQYTLTFLFTLLVINIISIVVWFINKETTIAEYNDRLFLTTISIASLGFLIAIVSKSRHHYYFHLKKKFQGNRIDDVAFEAEEERRHFQTGIGMAIGISGVFGVFLSLLITCI